MSIKLTYNSLVALLIMGSAISLFSCSSAEVKVEARSNENLMTEFSRDLRMTMSENGRPSYIFKAPIVEGYGLAREPYREFREGVEIVTYNDTLNTKDATLTSNYAIYYEKRKLWEAKGDVVVIKEDGKQLYTQQLFWNSTTKRIYSNVDTKIVDITSGDTYIGEGFESDEQMEDWKFRKMKGRMNVDMSAARPKRDSTKVDKPSAAKPAAESKKDARVGESQLMMQQLPKRPQRGSAARPQENKSRPTSTRMQSRSAEVNAEPKRVEAIKRVELDESMR